MAFIYQCLNITSIYDSLDSSITHYTPATMSLFSETSSSSASQNSPFMKPKELPLVNKSPLLWSARNLRYMTAI
jgi:hypothetical protein